MKVYALGLRGFGVHSLLLRFKVWGFGFKGFGHGLAVGAV